MSITLAEARTQVSQLVDDEAGAKWSVSEVDLALRFSMAEIVAESLQNGSGTFLTSSTLSADSTGQISLAATPPMKIHNVSFISGNQRTNVRPATRAGNFSYPSINGMQFEITYTAKPSLPALASDPIEFCVDGADNDVLNAYLCVKAARHLKPKEGEIIQGLEIRSAELQRLVIKLSSGPVMTSRPFTNGRSFSSPYQWFQKDNLTIQIVFPLGY